MQSPSQRIENLLRQADECELLGGLAADARARRANRARAAMLRELASESQMIPAREPVTNGAVSDGAE